MIPGPKSLPIIGNALMFFGSLEKVEKMFYEQDQIGFKNDEPLRRFWIGNLLIVHALSPEASKVILESKTETYKGIGYDFFYDWLGNGLVTSDGDKWKQRKKLIAPSFSFNMLKKYFETFNKESKAIVERYEVFAKSGEEVEILETIKRAALDILCETAMGVKVNIADNPNHPYHLAVKRYFKLATIHFKNIFYQIPYFYYLFGDKKEKNKLIVILKTFTQNIIKQKTEEFEKNNEVFNENTFLSNLLKFKKENELNDDDIREEVDTFMVAGHDTSSSLASFLWWSLACYQDIQEKVYQEIYDVFGEEERDVLPEDLPKLKYTKMVIEETLRMYPTVPYFNRTLKNEVEVCGYTLPKGTMFVFPLQQTSFNPKIFPDPFKFDPNRFLPENISKINPYAFIPFSSGLRNCVGQKFAMNQIKIMLVWVLRRFKLTTKRDKDYVKTLPEIVQTPVNGIPIVFKKRKPLLF
ncbi:Cytochrome P450 4V2 [Strongyloides ratti]|uniref:Cytochrome P450 4V2 n=1 Tax=Strongyloides ratti TaxID=34506 RepID=A0A090L5H4_STRRB|nr:Cytochrome P450 4V2 [Strongyloides ratti]CEF64982.1 Cytochrome P450 4V2 [Strongyloides ratti]